MNDREMLELAAKAAGIRLGEFWTPFLGRHHAQAWNPLTDDGDALRLAVKLGMEVYIDTHPEGCECTEVKTFAPHPDWIIINHEGNPSAATRHAIVRAAAAIGEKT